MNMRNCYTMKKKVYELFIHDNHKCVSIGNMHAPYSSQCRYLSVEMGDQGEVVKEAQHLICYGLPTYFNGPHAAEDMLAHICKFPANSVMIINEKEVS
jgi:hypothetical protein